jgi:hypothetical protein
MNEVMSLLRLRESDVRVVFDLSASDNLMAPSLPILLSAVSENEIKATTLTTEIQ